VLKCDANAIVAQDGQTTKSDVSGDPRGPKNNLKNLIEIDSSVFQGLSGAPGTPKFGARIISLRSINAMQNDGGPRIAGPCNHNRTFLVTGSLKNKLPEMFVVTYSPFFKRFREHQASRKSEVIDF